MLSLWFEAPDLVRLQIIERSHWSCWRKGRSLRSPWCCAVGCTLLFSIELLHNLPKTPFGQNTASLHVNRQKKKFIWEMVLGWRRKEVDSYSCGQR